MGISLDHATASWLVGLDPSLTGLPHALRACSPDDPWSLHDVRWTPGRGCRLVHVDDTADFVAVDVNGDDWVLNPLHDDASLPALSAAADPTEVASRLSSVLGEAVECTIEPVRYRPGSRCVMRYDVRAASGRSTFYAKVLQPDSYQRVSTLHAAMAELAVPPAMLPEMVAWWPDLHVVVGRSVGGRSASSVLGDPRVPADARARLGRVLGEVLAKFHGLPAGARSTKTADHQVLSLADAMGAVERAGDGMGTRLGAVLDTLAATTPPPGVPVLGHGSFRAGQVAVPPGGKPVLLDTDEVCLSDRERDLSVALAHLTWQGVRQPHNQSTLALAEKNFLASYEESAETVRPEALRWWRAAGLVQVAVRRYRRLEVGAWPLVGALAEAAEDLLAGERRSADRGDHLSDTHQASLLLSRAVGHKVEVESTELLGTAPGRRRVLRYVVRGIDHAHEAEGVPVIAKQFAEARKSRLSYYHLRQLAEDVFGDGAYRVPRPVGHVGEHRLLFYREDPGAPLDSLLGEPTGVDGVRSAARWLARLHASNLRLPRELSMQQEIESTTQWAALIAAEHPPTAPAAEALAARWAVAARSIVVDAAVPIHKDFHPGHVLVGAHTCVIDLDEARMGDPAFDVAHFCTYLDQVGEHSLTDVFLDEYTAASGWVDKGSFAPFCAYTCLKIAKQALSGSGPFRGAPFGRRLAAADAALIRGATWLDG